MIFISSDLCVSENSTKDDGYIYGHEWVDGRPGGEFGMKCNRSQYGYRDRFDLISKIPPIVNWMFCCWDREK